MSRIGQNIPKHDISCGTYASKWGVTDFYEECEAKLKALFNSGEDFETEWLECQKEVVSVKYTRAENSIRISVASFIDDLWEQIDLINDALYECFDDEELIEKLLNNNEFIDAVRDEAFEMGIDDNYTLSVNLSSSIAYEQVIEETDRIADAVGKELDLYFAILCDIIRALATYYKGE